MTQMFELKRYLQLQIGYKNPSPYRQARASKDLQEHNVHKHLNLVTK